MGFGIARRDDESAARPRLLTLAFAGAGRLDSSSKERNHVGSQHLKTAVHRRYRPVFALLDTPRMQSGPSRFVLSLYLPPQLMR